MFGQDPEQNRDPQSIPKLGSQDKRYLPRWEVNNRILYRLEDDPTVHECRSVDISCNGACLASNKDLPAKQKVQLTIYLNEHTTIKTQGEIVWNKSYDAGNLTGVVFVNTSPGVQELILDHAFEFKKKDLIDHWFKGWKK